MTPYAPNPPAEGEPPATGGPPRATGPRAGDAPGHRAGDASGPRTSDAPGLRAAEAAGAGGPTGLASHDGAGRSGASGGASGAGGAGRSPPPRRVRALALGSVYVFVVALLVAGRVLSDEFLSAENLMLTVKDVSILGIVAVGCAFITMSGHYVDLSIPAIMACAGIVAVYLLPWGFAPAVAAGLAVGGLMGLVNGLAVGYLRLNPILWTLAAMSVFDGATRWAYGGKWVYAHETTASGAAFADLYRGTWVGVVPVSVALFALAALAGHFAMNHTGWGRRLRLTGASYEAARLSGVPVRRVVAGAFVLSGLASALGGLIKTSLNMYGDVEIGLTYDFQAVTAVVIGGVTLAGGRGSMVGVIGGVLVIGLLGRILPLVPGVGQDEQFIIRGLIFIAAVAVGQAALRRAGRSDA